MHYDVVGLGAGGHAKVVVEILNYERKYNVVGLLDPRSELVGCRVGGALVLGNDDLLSSLIGQGVKYAFIGVGGAGNTIVRKKLFESCRSKGIELVNAIHPTAILASRIRMLEGITVMAGAIISADVHLGYNTIINTGAIVDHDCCIGVHAHVAPGVRLAGGVQVGDSAFVGIGTTVIQSVMIGEGAIIGAGSVVVEDVPAYAVVAGVPAKKISPTAGT